MDDIGARRGACAETKVAIGDGRGCARSILETRQWVIEGEIPCTRGSGWMDATQTAYPPHRRLYDSFPFKGPSQ